MENTSFFSNPLFWTATLLGLGFLLRWLNKKKEPEKPSTKPIKLFTIKDKPTKTRHVPYQYVHFGVKSMKDDNLITEKDKIQPEKLKGMEYLNYHKIKHTTQSCDCGSDSPIFVDLITISGQTLHTENGTTPTGTISSPTGQDAPKKECMHINIISENPYIVSPSALSLAHYLPDTHINPSKDNGKEKVKIALIDTGLDRNCKSDMFLSGAETVCEKFNGPDIDGHGTFVYYLTKVGLAKKGITNYEIYPYNVANCNGDLILSNILCAIVDAVSKGIKTINLSFGFYEHLPVLQSFFNLIFEHYKDVKFICSAGNNDLKILPYNNVYTTYDSNTECVHPPSYYHQLSDYNLYQITSTQFASDNSNLIRSRFTNFELSHNLACQGLFRMKLNDLDCEFGGTSFASPFFTGYYADLNAAALANQASTLIASAPFGNVSGHVVAIHKDNFIPNQF